MNTTVTYITDTNTDRRASYLILDGGRDGIYNAISGECEPLGLTDGYADVWETLTVLEEIGGDVERFLD